MNEDEVALPLRLLNLLPEDGSAQPNAKLRQRLQIEGDEYWAARDQLVTEGLAIVGRGRGGATARVVSPSILRDSNRRAGSKWWGFAEVATYVLSAVALIGLVLLLIFVSPPEGWLGYPLSIFSLSVTAFAAGVAVTIYRVQSRKQNEDQNAQGIMLRSLTEISTRTLNQTVDTAAGWESFLVDMGPAREAAAQSAMTLLGADEVDHSPERPLEPERDQAAKADLIQIPNDGEYLRPRAVPLRVLSDLVQWWEGPGAGDGTWTVGNLVGAYRRYNGSGNFQGVPWIVTFRRSNGELQEYRVSYSGRKRFWQQTALPTVSLYVGGEQHWVEGGPAAPADEG